MPVLHRGNEKWRLTGEAAKEWDIGSISEKTGVAVTSPFYPLLSVFFSSGLFCH